MSKLHLVKKPDNWPPRRCCEDFGSACDQGRSCPNKSQPSPAQHFASDLVNAVILVAVIAAVVLGFA